MKQHRIKIIDAIMGAGKSTYMINYINFHRGKYIVVVPTLDEIDRYKNAIQNVSLFDPKAWGKTKTQALQELIVSGKSIITTHALIQRLTGETLSLLREQRYTLIIDESLPVMDNYNIAEDDLKLLFNSNYVKVKQNGFLEWNVEYTTAADYEGDKFSDVRQQCDIGSLIAYPSKDGNINKIIWSFPKDFFECFPKTYILTYGWNGCFQKAYFDLHKIQYEHMSLKDGEIHPYNIDYELKQRQKFSKLINICSKDSLNAIGLKEKKQKEPLSLTWYKEQPKSSDSSLNTLSKNVSNYMKNHLKAKSKDIMWTTFKDYELQLASNGYRGSSKNITFVPVNAKATNQYSHKKALSYLVNRYPQPDLVKFLSRQGIKIDYDLYALCEMLQWIWRSAIRNNEPINIYIPSKRMRNMLEDWLAGRL